MPNAATGAPGIRTIAGIIRAIVMDIIAPGQTIATVAIMGITGPGRCHRIAATATFRRVRRGLPVRAGGNRRERNSSQVFACGLFLFRET